MASATRRAYLQELFWNQLWQSANFAAKAGFLILLTPLMLWKWGAAGYGLFALASSLLVSMALLDGGVRALTRLRLADAHRRNDDAGFARAYGEGMLTFACACLVAVAAAFLLAGTGGVNRWLNLPAGGEWVLALTAAMTAVFMLTSLALEPLAAKGNLSALKAANTWGALAAIPFTAAAVALGGSVLLAIGIYFACLTLPNFALAARAGIFPLLRRKGIFRFDPGVIWQTLRAGFWYYLTTVSLVIKTHGLTFVVAAIAGPAEAGMFYILLRLTEIVGNVGATASETSLAALAAARDADERRENFRQSWLYTGIFCLHGALVMALLGEPLLRFWLPEKELVPAGAGWAMAVFGLAGAFSRVVVNAGMGLHLVKPAALGNALEALADLAGAVAGYHLAGLPGLFVGGSIGIGFLLGPAWKIAGACGAAAGALYLASLGRLVPGLLIAAAAQAVSVWLFGLPGWLAALGISGAAALGQIRRLHR
ncbi:MAG TPA: hypothetical protein VIS74_06955 [Chthoniobacterales bacterium]